MSHFPSCELSHKERLIANLYFKVYIIDTQHVFHSFVLFYADINLHISGGKRPRHLRYFHLSLIIVLMRLVVLADKLYFICIHVYHCFHVEYVDVGI